MSREPAGESLTAFLDFITQNAASFWAWLLTETSEHPAVLIGVAVFLLLALWVYRGRRSVKE